MITDADRARVAHHYALGTLRDNLEELGIVVPRACCMRRARARYWRIARGYLACGLVLGIALGMVLGAASKVCQ